MAKELGKKIRTIRLKRNLSQTEMADILGYSGKGMISRLENGSADMSYDKLMLLLSKFGDDFTEEEKILVPIAKQDSYIQTKRLHIKRLGYKELDDLLSIEVSKFQREFVAENSIAVAEAYAAEKEGTKTECFVAYENNKPIGFVSIAFGSIAAEGEKEWMRESYCLWRIMVDSIFQNKGYGGEILDAVIEWCSSMPLGKSEKVYTSCYKNNTQAINLHHSRRFVETGEIVDGKIVLSRIIEERHDE